MPYPLESRMEHAVLVYLPAHIRRKLYLILAFASLFFLLLNIEQVFPVTVVWSDFLGLLSHLSPSYWIGLVLIVLDAVFVFLDCDLKEDKIFILILIVLGLFLLGIAPLVEGNARDPSVYYPTAEVQSVLATHHLNFNNPLLSSYNLWPALHLISASIILITGVGLGFIKYVPIFLMLGFILITYSIGKRLGLVPNQCFLISFLALSSWMTICAGYDARTIGMVLFLLLFMLWIAPKREKNIDIVVPIIIFSALVLTHALVSIAALAAIITVSLYQKNVKTIIPFVIVSSMWYLYQASTIISWGVTQVQPFLSLFTGVAGPLAEGSGTLSISRIADRYSALSYPLLYLTLVIASVILILRHRITGRERRTAILALFWSVPTTLNFLLAYGGEGPYRIYLLCLLPALVIISLCILRISSRKFSIILMCLFVLLFLLANYAAEGGYPTVFSTDLKGGRFFVNNVVQPQSIFYGADPALIYFSDPNMTSAPMFNPGWWPSPANLTLINIYCKYVILSSEGTNQEAYSLGFDLYNSWPSTQVGIEANLIYNNGNSSFRLYENNELIVYFP